MQFVAGEILYKLILLRYSGTGFCKCAEKNWDNCLKKKNRIGMHFSDVFIQFVHECMCVGGGAANTGAQTVLYLEQNF